MHEDAPAWRLGREKSPYLLQHAHQPVAWYPWGEEAFERARREDKPIFLSIGYATCHWCHVMAHESFDDDEVAALLNNGYVSIKVDREERPDIDHLYMSAAHILSRQGGWPLTIVMTPDRRPFFAATYLPIRQSRGMAGLIEVLSRISELWRDNRNALLDAAGKVSGILTLSSSDPASPLADDASERCRDELFSSFDPSHGGFGVRPKFPSPHTLIFLLRHARRTGDPEAADMATATLRALRRGGIHDHVGGGFHRYATDEAWKVPHFEKMLYDQALSILAYTEGYAATGEEAFLETARSTARYVCRDLAVPEGAFASAEDADDPGGEGAYYTWTYDEAARILGPDLLAWAQELYGITPEGNYVDEAEGRRTGRSILHMDEDVEAVARRTGTDATDVLSRRDAILSALSTARAGRLRPPRDDKVLTDWNGLMIAALARLHAVSGEEWPLDAARKAAAFVLGSRTPEGALYHRYRDGEHAVRGMLADYAFLAWGCLELYAATRERPYLDEVASLVSSAVDGMWDAKEGGFFMAPAEASDLLVRQKETYDGAMPSGSSAMLYCLALLGLYGDERWGRYAEGTMASAAGMVNRSPSAHAFLLVAADLATGPWGRVTVTVNGDREGAARLVEAYHTVYAPHIVLSMDTGAARDGGGSYAVLCRDRACQAPVREPSALALQLARVYERQMSREEKEEIPMKKFRCLACGYIYDPAKGDDEADIPPGTAFEDLPEDWVCPACGVGKDMFEEV